MKVVPVSYTHLLESPLEKPGVLGPGGRRGGVAHLGGPGPAVGGHDHLARPVGGLSLIHI